MRKERLLYILVGALFVTYVAVEYYSPKPLDWTLTFSQHDKNPYGGYILYERLEDFFPGKSLSFQTLYESRDSAGHILILARQFEPSEADIEALFQVLGQGRSILVSAQIFSNGFLDTLGITMDYNLTIPADSARVVLDSAEVYFPSGLVTSCFITDSLSNEWKVHAKAEGAVLISKHFQKANLILSTTPLAFTNYGVLYGDISRFVASSLRLLPFDTVSYNRYYHSGKSGPSTPLRYLLGQPSLRWAVYLALLFMILYMVISSRRVQRMIPLLDRQKNTTIDFIKTIGGLYYREGHHKNSAIKLISHFLKTLSERYYIHTYDEKSYRLLAAKTGLPVEEVIETFVRIEVVKQAERISEEGLKQLYEKINKFNLY